MKNTLLTSALLTLLAFSQTSLAELSMGQKVQLQSDMQRHIDATSNDGRYLHYDVNSGQLTTLFPAAGHPMILKHNQEDMYVLCSEMRDESGQSHNVDYYMAKVGTEYKVIKTVIGNRDPLKVLMQQGVVSKL